MTEVAQTIGENPDPGLLFEAGVADRPNETYRALRQQCPVARSTADGLPSVYLFDYETVFWALHHPEVFSSAAEALSLGQDQPLIPVQVDPPLHTKYRRLLSPAFSPKRIGESSRWCARWSTACSTSSSMRGRVISICSSPPRSRRPSSSA